ncbi:MAG TPA: IS1595 family transposase [Vampirovibrionales bacterium]
MPKNHEECLEILEQLRWNGIPTCPYCGSTRASAIKSEHRYHCHNCFTSYSVTVNTIFHKTRLGLDKWFYAIKILFLEKNKSSIRQLSKEIGVSTNTSAYLIKRINQANSHDKKIIKEIINFIQSQ